MAVKEWSADKIIAVGMMASLLITIIGADIVAVYNGSMEIASLGKEIIIGLFGYMGRGAVSSAQQNRLEGNVAASSCQSRMSETLGKVAATASEAKKAADAVDTISKVLKNK